MAGKNTVEIRLTLQDEITKAYKRVSAAIATNNKKIKTSMSAMKLSMVTSMKQIRKSFTFAKTAAVGFAAFITGRLIGGLIKVGTTVENLETQFVPLLGSFSAARDRIKELNKFAAETPFQLENIAKASKVLETLTNGTLSTGEGLRLVGDAAAQAGVNIDELATNVGRAYSQLNANRPAGEAIMRLQELGLVSGDTRNKIEDLSKAARGVDAWKALKAELDKTSGGMKLMADTAAGMISTLKDQVFLGINEALKQGGLWDQFKEDLDSLRTAMDKFSEDGTFTRWGNWLRITVNVIRIFINVIQEMAEVISLSLSLAINLAVDGFKVLAESAKTSFKAIYRLVVGDFKGAMEELKDTSALDAFNLGVGTAKELFKDFAESSKQNAKDIQTALDRIKPPKAITDKEGDFKKPSNASGSPSGSGALSIPGIPTAEQAQEIINRNRLMMMDEDKRAVAQLKARYMEELSILELHQRDTADLTMLHEVEMANLEAGFKERDLALAEEQKDKMLAIAKEESDRKIAIKRAEVNAQFGLASQVIGLAKVMAGENKTLFAFEQGLAASRVIFSTLEGMAKAAALSPLTAGQPMAGLIAAQGAVGVATIMAETIKGFQNGGILGGTSTSGDKTLYRGNAGEMILNKAQQNNLLSIANGHGGSNITFEAPVINVANGNPAVIAQAVTETYQEQIKRFADMQRDAKVLQL